MKIHLLDKKTLQQELLKTQVLEVELSNKLKELNKANSELHASWQTRLKKLCESLKESCSSKNSTGIYPFNLSVEEFRVVYKECLVNSDKEELKRLQKICRKKKGLIAFLLRFISFRKNISSIFRKFILRFNLKNMSDESGSDNNIVVFKNNLYYALILIINEKHRQRILR